VRHKPPWDDEQWERRWEDWWHRWEARKRGRKYPGHRPPFPLWHHHPTSAERREWRRGFRGKRGCLFFRFAGVFGFMVLLVLGGMAALAFTLTRLFGGDGQTAVMVWIGGCGLALTMPILAGLLARRTFQEIATPLADVMTAADAVAEGDLSARVDVPSHGPNAFSRLANSFNRMVEELQHADQQRRNLTADVAHELRTPLHIIQGNLEGILDDVYQPTEEHINATLDETRTLARLVEDLRTLSLAEAGQLPLVKETVDVAELLADVHTSFSGQAEAAGIDLRVTTKDGTQPMTIIGDVGRLDQVLSNLLANALRHTPAGGTITLQAESCEEGVHVTVRDTGEGIPAEDLPYIFDRFWRGDRSRSHAGGAGSGLGLAIARQLVQSHGGRIDVQSEAGQGTTFTIHLPAGNDKT
jgi:two-component system sensor histidine kinase BaeS